MSNLRELNLNISYGPSNDRLRESDSRNGSEHSVQPGRRGGLQHDARRRGRRRDTIGPEWRQDATAVRSAVCPSRTLKRFAKATRLLQSRLRRV